jgi:hypothetical protein
MVSVEKNLLLFFEGRLLHPQPGDAPFSCDKCPINIVSSIITDVK